MKRFHFLFVTGFLLVLSHYANAQFSRVEAINLVLDSIIYEDLNHVDVIASLAEKPDSIGVQLEDNTVLDLPYPENWVFFVNDKPFANWHHPCRYLLVNGQNG